MEKSRIPGTASSINLASAETALHRIAASPEITAISDALGTESDLHLVGGLLRKVLRGESTAEDDWDLSSNLSAESAIERLSAAGIHSVPTGVEHGTITIVLPDKKIELTTFRAPSARDKTLSARSIEEDLSGRDFTINALAFSVVERRLIDPFDGISDLKNNVLRTVNSPGDRFQEDPLRILRMIRFGPAQGRTVEEATSGAAHLLKDRLNQVSIERIRDEFCKILVESEASMGIREMHRLDLLGFVLPEIIPTVGFEQNEYHLFNLFDHILAVLDLSPQDLDLRLTALLHDLGKVETLSVDEQGMRHFYKHEHLSAEIAEAYMERMRFSKSRTAKVARLVKFHMRPLDCGPAGVRRLMRDLDEDLESWLKFKRADFIGTRMEEGDYQEQEQRFLEQVKTERERPVGSPYSALAVDGADLLALGLKEGPRVGKLLAELNELVIEEPERNTKEYLLRAAKEKILQDTLDQKSVGD